VSGYEARCPGCGAPVVFELGSTVLRVCEHCGSAVVRKGVNLESYGKVAQLIPTASVLKLGLEGGYAGAPRFRLVGHVQLDHGAGTWDEWLLGFEGGASAWLSEAQGRFHYMGAAPLPPVPAFEDLRAGHTVDLGQAGTFVVTEVRKARFASAEGELPFAAAPGTELHYADLSGPRGRFATLDFGPGSRAEALYVGQETTLEELGVTAVPADERRKKASAGALSCPNCAGPLEIRAPDQTQRVACPYCGSLLDATRNLAVLEAIGRPQVTPRIPLGSKGRLHGVEWTVIGFLERSVTAEGIRYPWQEYLLYEPKRGFRWLVESKGHWSFVEPLNPGDVDRPTSGLPMYEGLSFRHFQGGEARVDHVLGEFYWAVARGETVQTSDYVSPPYMLSSEGTEQEIVWSRGTYTEGAEVWKAFRVPGEPPYAHGVAPHQPSPFKGRVGRAWRTAALAVAGLLAVFIGFSLNGCRTVHQQVVAIPADAKPATPEAAIFTDPFVVDRRGNLEVTVTAPVANSWLYLDGALINEETGTVDEFDVEVSYYWGSDSDGSWSEGGPSTRRYIGGVEPGRYVLRLQPQWQGQPPRQYNVTVRSRVPRFYMVVLGMLALLAWPVLVAMRSAAFETQRWSESDHSSSGSDDEDDEPEAIFDMGKPQPITLGLGNPGGGRQEGNR
jgi:hypothetical protein